MPNIDCYKNYPRLSKKFKGENRLKAEKGFQKLS